MNITFYSGSVTEFSETLNSEHGQNNMTIHNKANTIYHSV